MIPFICTLLDAITKSLFGKVQQNHIPKFLAPLEMDEKWIDYKLIIQWNNGEVLLSELIDLLSAEPKQVSSDDEEIENIEDKNYDDIIF